MAESGDISKPKVLILGGCGFIGRNLVDYIITNSLASKIRVVDKVPPQVAWMNPKHDEIFNNSIVEFKSANLINAASCENAFSPPEWDYVINCACETRPGQTDPVYQEGIFKLSLNCANLAAKQKVKHYVELSTGNMYSSDKIAHKEDGPLEPWTPVAKWKSRVESEISDIPNLNYTILRPAIIYGLGDKTGLVPRLLIAAIYKYLGETMKLLWTSHQKLNTVHVLDVVRAIWHVCSRDDTVKRVYNVVDTADTTQGSITDIIADLFSIQYEYLGSIMSTIAKTDLAVVVEEVNDKHLGPWAEVCKLDGVENTPLTPYMSEEQLYGNHLFLDSSALRNIDFTYSIPTPTKALLQEIITDYVKMKVFPKSLAN